MDRVKPRFTRWLSICAAVVLAAAAVVSGAPRGVTHASALIAEGCDNWWECSDAGDDGWGDSGDGGDDPGNGWGDPADGPSDDSGWGDDQGSDGQGTDGGQDTSGWDTQPGEVIQVSDTAPYAEPPPPLSVPPGSAPPPCTPKPGYVLCFPAWCDPAKLDRCDPIQLLPNAEHEREAIESCVGFPPQQRVERMECERKMRTKLRELPECRRANREIQRLKAQEADIIRKLKTLGWSPKAIAIFKNGFDSRYGRWERFKVARYCDYIPPGSDETI